MSQLGLFGPPPEPVVVRTFATRVVNLRHEPFDVYIGRAGHGYDGFHGNPIVPGRSCLVCRDGTVHVGPGDTLGCYAVHLDARLARDATYRRAFEALRGLALGCFCRPRGGFAGVLRCHGQILAGRLEGVDPALIP